MRANWVSFCGTFFNAEELRKQVDTIRRLLLLNVSNEAEQELVTEQIKSIVRKLQQIKGDSGVRAKLLLGKWAAAQELDTDTTLDCKECGKTFSTSANLRWHLTTQHNKQKAVTEPPQSDEEETKLNWVIILCAMARSAFASLSPSHAKKNTNLWI